MKVRVQLNNRSFVALWMQFEEGVGNKELSSAGIVVALCTWPKPKSVWQQPTKFRLQVKNAPIDFGPSLPPSFSQMAHIDPNSAVYATDEYGRPFIIVRESQRKSRLSGIDAIRVCSWASQPLTCYVSSCFRSMSNPPPTVPHSRCKDCFQHHQDFSWPKR
jgi:hypothetical protein